MIPAAAWAAAGVAAGALIAYLFYSKRIHHLKSEILLGAERLRQAQDNLLREQAAREKILGDFRLAAADAVKEVNERLVSAGIQQLNSQRELSGKDLDNKKILIDQQLLQMTGQLEKVSGLVSELEKDRQEKFGQLSNQLKNTNDQTAALLKTTSALKETLASSRARGHLGELMAEDVLRVAGYKENISYIKQKTIEGTGSRPDFTFLLPKNLKLNMDVKFPLDNFLKLNDSELETEKEKYKNDFLRDIKLRLKEITTRDYINPEQNTVDYVILFVPSESIYAYIQEHEPAILDSGLKNKVIFCSPFTLFAVLAVIRQAIDNFALERTSNEILSLFNAFKTQWIKFLDKLDKVGKRIEDAQKEFDDLTTTRKGQLEKPLNKIESLRQQRGIPALSEEQVIELTAQEEPGRDTPA